MARLLMEGDDDHAAARVVYFRALGVRQDADRETIEREMTQVMPAAALARAAAALDEGGKRDGDLAVLLRSAARADNDAVRITMLQKALLTKEFEPRADNFVSKGVKEKHPEVFDQLATARDRLHRLIGEMQGLKVAEASLALMRLAEHVMQRYVDAKALTASLDFDDLVQRSAGLLSTADAAAWVLLKLDGGLDHILVDEAQDTSPVQWDVIRALAAEFFPVTGGQAGPRSVFAVGDEKQSIYSFQGAEPRMFAQSGAAFAEAARAAGLEMRRVPLTLSFRTVEPLLKAVDAVLSSPERTPGLSAGDAPIEHVAHRLGHAGCVEIWDTEKPDEEAPADAWLPLEEAPASSPVVRLADRVADMIAAWLERGETLVSEGRPVRAGDIIILLRRRRPFAVPMVAALKRRGIPVAGADRLRLTEQIAVQDLMVLGDFLTLPEDDLALATVLKSPLFDFSDDDLLTLAAERGQRTLWSSLIDLARRVPRFEPAASTLLRWRGIADQSPPFEFYAHVLDRDGGRQRLIGRLGPDSMEAITELLNLAVEFDEAETPSLTGFLAWLRSGTREVKRDMEQGRDEVRVLTVHGAKGLEAPIVILPDTCGAAAGTRQGDLVGLDGGGLAEGAARPIAWPVKGTRGIAAIKDGKAREQADAQAESNRLLYVAMTRARDRLYIAGWETSRGRAKGCWYDIILAGLDGRLERTADEHGRPVARIRSQQIVPAVARRDLAAAAVAPAEPPVWSRTDAPREARLAIPIAPSRLAPYEIDETGDPVPRAQVEGSAPREPETPSPFRLSGDYRFQRGLVTHALLEHLPALPAERWEQAAAAFAETRGSLLPPAIRQGIVREVLAVLKDPEFAAAFGPDSRAEVPLVAELPPPGDKGLPLRLNAVIDRLVVTDREVLIIDYKTNRPPPSEPSGVASAYVHQLAAYRLALQRIYPDRPVRAAILWTDGGRLMEIPDAMLSAHAAELWQLAAGRLDG
jgi:ATP-dependent helicase/nuclease subunit A